MGNDGIRGNYSGRHNFYGYNDGIDRSGWKPVSDKAQNVLETAKTKFVEFVRKHSFDTVPEENKNYKLTREHAIKVHVVTKLRPQFNKYVKEFGAQAKWVKLTESEKKSCAKFKHRKSAVYFCNITIDKDTKQKMIESNANIFNDRNCDLVEEISLFTKLTSIGVPEMDGLGWILKLPKDQKVEEIPKIKNLSQFLDEKAKTMKKIYENKLTKIFIETTEEYINDNGKNKKKKRLPQQISYSLNNNNSNNRKRTYADLIWSDSDSHYSYQRRRISQIVQSQNINTENVQVIKNEMSNYFRIYRVGQINKRQLLNKTNDNNNMEMNENELQKILMFLHEQNHIFYIDPMVHQL